MRLELSPRATEIADALVEMAKNDPSPVFEYDEMYSLAFDTTGAVLAQLENSARALQRATSSAELEAAEKSFRGWVRLASESMGMIGFTKESKDAIRQGLRERLGRDDIWHTLAADVAGKLRARGNGENSPAPRRRPVRDRHDRRERA